MTVGLEREFSQGSETNSAEDSSFETLSHVEHDLNDIIAALALLGVKRCSQCRQFFRASEPGALFDQGWVFVRKVPAVPEYAVSDQAFAAARPLRIYAHVSYFPHRIFEDSPAK